MSTNSPAPDCGADDRAVVTIRPYAEADQPFLRRVASRLYPGDVAAARDPEQFHAYFERLAAGAVALDGDRFVAVDAADRPLGLIAVGPDRDYFTDHPRAYVHILVVDDAVEGRGVGRALMRRAEDWARQPGMKEVVLDVFAGNHDAIAFYERCGYAVDHLRMAKPV
ncbi:MAG TPA: GNAT family N-acetyltransferase [Thermomicrobiales bacterium]|nr:GNAT family N-acetyltransferase [Thermomicrobiales bacterium]